MIESSGNVAILKNIESVESWMGSKILLLHMNSVEVGATLKHTETINGKVKNWSKNGIFLLFHFLS